MDESVWHWVVASVKQGLSANESLRQLRTMGAGIRRGDFLDLYRSARENLGALERATELPGERRPYVKEMLPLFTVAETGYLQTADIWVRDQETGEVYSRPYSVRTDDLMTHGDVIETALDRYAEHADNYGHDILGATYNSTIVYVPKGQ